MVILYFEFLMILIQLSSLNNWSIFSTIHCLIILSDIFSMALFDRFPYNFWVIYWNNLISITNYRHLFNGSSILDCRFNYEWLYLLFSDFLVYSSWSISWKLSTHFSNKMIHLSTKESKMMISIGFISDIILIY